MYLVLAVFYAVNKYLLGLTQTPTFFIRFTISSPSAQKQRKMSLLMITTQKWMNSCKACKVTKIVMNKLTKGV